MQLKASDILFSLGFIIIGIIILKERWSHMYSQPVPPIAGYVCIVFGVVWFIMSFKNKKNGDEKSK